jgi:hypothetical protein
MVQHGVLPSTGGSTSGLSATGACRLGAAAGDKGKLTQGRESSTWIVLIRRNLLKAYGLYAGQISEYPGAASNEVLTV